MMMVYTVQKESVGIRMVSKSAAADSGKTCPNTGLYFPDVLYIDNKNINIEKAKVVQVDSNIRPAPHYDALAFFAMGTYYKAYFGVVINVYTVALYVDRDGLLADPIVPRFRGQNVTAGEGTVPFVESLLAEVAYDRVVLIQLAMTLSKSTLLKGLVDDLPMKDEHKVRAAQTDLYSGSYIILSYF
jgi:hypothetical protein